MAVSEFSEIAACGGTITVKAQIQTDGERAIWTELEHSASTTASWFMIWASEDGEPVVSLLSGVSAAAAALQYQAAFKS